MPLTRDFRETVKERAQRDPAFRAALYQEALQAIVEGDLPTARILLRDFINATIGFSTLADSIGVPDKSLMRMFGRDGNPRAIHLLDTLAALKRESGASPTVHATPQRKSQKQHKTTKEREFA
jgi:hypothetical protein